MYTKFKSFIVTRGGFTESFETSTGVLQGCLIPLGLFSLFLTTEFSVMDSLSGALVGGVMILKFAYADDIALISESLSDLNPSPIFSTQPPTSLGDHQRLENDSHALLT